jgi:hypothetical protein
VEANPNRAKDNRVGSLTLSVARTRLAQLANASGVKLRLPSGEHIKLSREQLSALADFISRMSPWPLAKRTDEHINGARS